MIFKLIFLFTLLHLASSQIGEECEVGGDFPSFMEHPTNCSRFLACANGIWYEMECPARLQWNQEQNVCDWPLSANCKPKHVSNQTDDGQMQPFMAGDDCDLKDENSLKVSHHPSDCKKFFICNRKWIEMECPRGLLFSVESNHCEFIKDAKCCEKCEVAKRECEVDGSRLVHAENCQKFYECKNGTLNEEKCKDDEHYDPIIGECIEGDCGNFEVQPAIAFDLPDCPFDGVLYPNYSNCKKFFICNGGALVEQSCPPLKLFSIYHGDCEYESYAVCAGNHEENKL